MNCMAYALDAFYALENLGFLPSDEDLTAILVSHGVTTSNQYLPIVKTFFETWLTENLGSDRWENVTLKGGIEAELHDDQWLIVMRVGYHDIEYDEDSPSNNDRCLHDYHFWYRTNTGEWVNKHGYESYSQALGNDLPTDNDSLGWYWSDVPEYYDSDLIYYRITLP